MFSALGDTISAFKVAQCTWGISLHWGYTISELGDVQCIAGIFISALGDIMISVGGYHQCIGDIQCIGGYHQCFGGYEDLCGGILSVHWRCSATILISPNALIISANALNTPQMHS